MDGRTAIQEVFRDFQCLTTSTDTGTRVSAGNQQYPVSLALAGSGLAGSGKSILRLKWGYSAMSKYEDHELLKFGLRICVRNGFIAVATMLPLLYLAFISHYSDYGGWIMVRELYPFFEDWEFILFLVVGSFSVGFLVGLFRKP